MTRPPGPGRLSRRDLLRQTTLTAALTMSGSPRWAASAAERQPARPRPNVLFIAIDDLNDWVGVLGGHPQTRTPNIDALARRGVLFRRAYCQVPLCNPSRTSVLSGIRPTTSGLYDNPTPWRQILPRAVPLPEYFVRAGYHVVGGGKVFHHKQHDNGTRWHEYYDSEWERFPRPENTPANGIPGARRFDWGPVAVNDEDTPDTKLAQWASSVLARTHPKPFFLACGFVRPHLPWYAPRKYFDLFPPGKTRLPDVLDGDLDDVPRAALTDDKLTDHRRVLSTRNWQKAVASYLACITYTDANIGRVLTALDRSPYRTNTVIVLWSDNGFQLGEKQHWRKSTLWERSCHIPLIIVAPGVARENQRCGRTVELLDLFPTLLELCGLPSNPAVEGRSLVPLLRNPNAPWPHPAITSLDPDDHTVRTERWRYTRYWDGSEELYDHQSDPHEWHNLAERPPHQKLKKQLMAKLPRVEGGRGKDRPKRSPEADSEDDPNDD